jgi:hypothetical protein
VSRGHRVALLCAACTVLAGCGTAAPGIAAPPVSVASTAPEASPTQRPPTQPPSIQSSTAPAPLPVPATSSPAGFPRDTAVSCAGNPTPDRIVALVRAQGILDGTQTATATVGPLCAGTWQYTVLQAPQREPLQVVSQGPATALVLVTAGTDVCTDPVRTQAPQGIIAAAHC